jgi:hypothetical protein
VNANGCGRLYRPRKIFTLPLSFIFIFCIIIRLIQKSTDNLKELFMNVLGSVKKFSVGGMFIGALVVASSLSFTGCLTDDKDPETPAGTDTALVAKSAVGLGAQKATPGSSLDIDTWSVYTMTPAKANSTKIDLIFAYSTVGAGQAAIYSPNVAVNGLNGSGGFDFLEGFTSPNTTEIKTTTATYAAIANRRQLDSVWSAGTAVAAGKLEITTSTVFLAKSNLGKVAIIQTSNLVTGENGSVSLAAKAKAFD